MGKRIYKNTLLISGGMALIALAAQAADPVTALGSGDKPVEITSDSLEVLQEHNKAIFSGHVVAIQGDTRLKADRMTVYYRKSGETAEKTPVTAGQGAVSRIDVEGNVFLATPQDTAKGDTGVYDVDKRQVQLFTNVVLTQGQNVLKGSALTYNLDTGRSVVTGNATPVEDKGKKPAQRVRMLIIPENKNTGK